METVFLALAAFAVVTALGYQLGRRQSLIANRVPVDLILAAVTGAIAAVTGATGHGWWPLPLMIAGGALAAYLHTMAAQFGTWTLVRESAPARDRHRQRWLKLRHFIESLTREQGDAIFGQLVQGRLLSTGIIEHAKSEVILRVLHGVSLPSEMDEISHLGLDERQMERLRGVLSPEQMTEFVDVFAQAPPAPEGAHLTKEQIEQLKSERQG